MHAPDPLPAAAILDELDKNLARDVQLEDVWGSGRVAAQKERNVLSEKRKALLVTLSYSAPHSASEKDELLRLASAMVARLKGDVLDDGERDVTPALARRLVDRAREYQGQDAGVPSRWPHIAVRYGE